MKKCSTCLLTKSETEYFKASTYKDKVYYRNECKDCTRAYLRSEAGQASQKKYRDTDSAKEVKRKYKSTPKYREQQREYELNRLKEDPLFKLRKTVRDRTRIALRRKRFKKGNNLSQYLGCTIPELKDHIEKQFKEGMTWKNHGDWHIDHIIPLDSGKTPEEIYKLCHFTNLQPLWAEHNLKKGNKPQ